MTTRHVIGMVGLLLLLASLACYSDSPLYPYDLTATPVPPTPLPPPAEGQALFSVGDMALAPAAVSDAGFRLVMTTSPEPLAQDLSNRVLQPCTANSILRILYSGVAANGRVYHLIDCNGVVGWTPEDTILGPLPLMVGQRALTTEAGTNEAGQFKIEASDPPYRPEDRFRQQFDCRVNDTVDVIGIAGFNTGEVYYKISCTNPINPIAPNIGWTTPQALFGPVRFRNGESGIVPLALDAIQLTSEAGSGEVVATCQSGEVVSITETPVQRLDDALFYEMECAEGRGWANQEGLAGPLAFAVGDRVLVTAPQQRRILSAEAETQPESPLTATPDESALEVTSTPAPLPRLSVPLTDAPGVLVADNQAGECLDASLTTIEAFAGVEGVLYVRVTCEGVTGWLEQNRLYGPARFALGEQVELGESALLGFNEQGIYLSREVFDIQGASGGSSVIAGECAFDFTSRAPVEAELLEVSYYYSSTGAVVGIFYRARCLDSDGNPIEGWINQERIGA